MGMVGPSVASTRARKPRSRKGRKDALPTDLQLPSHPSSSLPSMNTTVGPLSYSVDASAFGFGQYAPPQLYPSYGQGQMPIQAQYMGSHHDIDFAALSASYMQSSRNPSPVPSTSSSEGSSSGSSASAEEEVAPLVDEDKTPTAATFGNITIPRVPIVPNISHYANANHLLGLHDLSPYANMFQQQQHSSSQTQASVSLSSSCRPPHQDPGAAAYYSALFPSNMQQSPCADGLSSSSGMLPAEVRETFGVKGNPAA